MAEFDDELDMQRELDTRDSLASMAHYHVSSPGAVTTQVLPPSFIPTATGRIRPVTGTIPAIPSDAQEKTGADWPFRSIHTFAGCRLAS